MENCHGEFITTELNAKTCMDSVLSKRENPSKVHDISNTQSKSGTELRSEGIGMSNIPAQATNISQVPDGGLSGSELAGVNPECPNAANQILFAVLKWKKKPKMRKFAGDVRKHAIFAQISNIRSNPSTVKRTR